MYLVSESQASVMQIMSMVALIAVDMVAHVLPISLAISICIILFKFKTSNQMIALRSFGVPVSNLIKPVLLAAGIVTGALYSITLYLSPMSLESFKIAKLKLMNNISFPKHSGNLLNFGEISVFAEQYVGGFDFYKLIIVDNRDADIFRTYMAEAGRLDNGIISLKSGEIREFNKASLRMSSVKFNEHHYDLNEIIQKLSLSPSYHEMSSYTLLKKSYDLPGKAELSNRLISPLLAIILSLISLFCIGLRNNNARSLGMGEILYTILSITVVEGISLWFSNMMAKNDIFITVYGAFVLAMISGLSILIFMFLKK